MPKNLLNTAILLIIIGFTGQASAEESRRTVVIAGAGPSTQIVELFFESFSQTEYGKSFDYAIPARSIKHAGGINWSDSHLLGRTGRPLSPKEVSRGKSEILLASIPVVFVKGKSVGKINKIDRTRLLDILSGKINNWKQLGGPNRLITLVGREKTEASLKLIRKTLPEISSSHFKIIFNRDHQVVNFLNSEAGAYAIAFGSKPNFPPELVQPVTQLELSQPLGLVYDNKNRNNEFILNIIRHASSQEWNTVIHNKHWLPVSLK